jgi:hypothetical protein
MRQIYRIRLDATKDALQSGPIADNPEVIAGSVAGNALLLTNRINSRLVGDLEVNLDSNSDRSCRSALNRQLHSSCVAPRAIEAAWHIDGGGADHRAE